MENAWSVFLSAALGGSGLVGLVVWGIKRRVEQRAAVQAAELAKKEDTRQKIAAVLEHNQRVDKTLEGMAKENTLQCYCLLAALRGLEEQGCDGGSQWEFNYKYGGAMGGDPGGGTGANTFEEGKPGVDGLGGGGGGGSSVKDSTRTDGGRGGNGCITMRMHLKSAA